jgi:S1-C subfamily serine protease
MADEIKNNLTSEIPQQLHAKSISASALVTIILLSAIFGAVGGVFGLIGLSKSSWFGQFSGIASSTAPGQLQKNVQLSEDSAVIDVVKKASPAVVSIVISKDLNKIPGYGMNPNQSDPFFQFFGSSPAPRQNAPSTPNVQQIGAGSGFFVSSDGLILTNRHVVSDESASYSVLTSDGKSYDAKVLARDPVNDLAIIKIDIHDAPFLTFADSAKIQIGQRVVAIGNSLGQYQNTVTSGIISGIGRSIIAGGNEGNEQLDGVIQTDAAINPGNSGGPLLDSTGNVLGVNTAIDQEGQSVGFAIPSNDASRALLSFQRSGKITRPFLGVRYVIVTKDLANQQKLPRDYGALVLKGQTQTDLAVVPGSPADKAGIVENDILLEVNGKQINQNNTLASMIKNFSVGDILQVKLYHKGVEKTVAITLEESK